MLPPLLFITNPNNSDPEEDIFLSHELRDTFDVTVCDPHEALSKLPHFPRCLIRNAWPSRLFKNEFAEMKRICDTQNIKSYNPFHRNGNIEDKTYLVSLYRGGMPVIPTISSMDDFETLPKAEAYIIKPIDGCSSYGIEALTREQLRARHLERYVIQPEIDLKDEISLYFIDDVFTYATVSAGKNRRWELTEYDPTDEEIAWAMQFVQWNALPYGLQRIDACRTSNGELLLMEVESEMPMLTLSDISEGTKTRFLKHFKASLLENL